MLYGADFLPRTMSKLLGNAILSFFFQTARVRPLHSAIYILRCLFCIDQLNFRPLSIALLQHLLHLFRKRPSGLRVLPSEQVTGTDNLRLWIHVQISGKSKKRQKRY